METLEHKKWRKVLPNLTKYLLKKNMYKLIGTG